MKNKTFQIDALKICYRASDIRLLTELSALDIDEQLNFNNITLRKVDGRYYTNNFKVEVHKESAKTSLGTLQFGFIGGSDKDNACLDGKPKVWISIDNKALYPLDINTLEYVTESLDLEINNITTLDICLDTSFQTSTLLRKYYRNRDYDTILNGRVVYNRDKDCPEISRFLSGSLNKDDKYKTISVKQRKAIKRKSDGITLITYNKLAEIEESSNKQYILEYYGNPKRLYRTEVHLNNKEIRNYINNRRIILSYELFTDNSFLEDMFFHFLDAVIRFKDGRKVIGWKQILKWK